MAIEVSSAAKKPQALSDTATAMHVITREDMRRAGVTNIPEALRLAPGVQVSRIDASRYAITIRGFASRYAGKYVVTLSVDQVMFRQAINVGELVTFLASVNYTGTSSMEIGIKVIAENIRTQVVRHANSCFFTMVAVGEDGKPVPVPKLQPDTPDERRRHAAAQVRKQLRQEFASRFDELRNTPA